MAVQLPLYNIKGMREKKMSRKISKEVGESSLSTVDEEVKQYDG